VLSPGDRRAFLRALWDPFLPDAAWSGTAPRPAGTAQVYLDVSGSMRAEMPLVIALLARLSRHVRRPFWAFSDEVAPAVIERGQLRTRTTGGTSLACVLEHVARTRPRAAVIVTDGYVEPIALAAVAPTRATRLHAVVTRDGDPSALRRAGIPYSQLERLPA
jgi:predicted metal-dependent peptidase